MFRKLQRCRACQDTHLTQVFSLPPQPLANDFQWPDAECAGYAPLQVLFCRTCTLAQLSVVVKPEILYRNYPYVTSDSHMMKVHFETLQTDIVAEFLPGRLPKKWLEIGSNNGAFLESLHRFKMETLGLELARNLAAIAEQRGVKTIDREFNCPSAIELGATGYRADVIVARHVFAHIDDWQGFIRGLEMVSHQDTLVVIEVPWVVDMLNMNSWDQCYHEHLSYVSVGAVQKLIEGTPFYVDSVKRYSIHGGAIGIFLRRRENHERIALDFPEEQGLEARWRNMDAQQLTQRRKLTALVSQLNATGKKVCGFGASAKATVWCNALGATSKQIAFVCDCAETKIGKVVPGTDIPVVPHSRLMEADAAINFAWNYHAEIAGDHKAFTDKGGKWILPIPEVKVLP